MKRLVTLAFAVLASLALAPIAFASADMTRAVAVAKHPQYFMLAVPTENENATTTTIELTVPSGFAIDSFGPSPGWTRELQQSGSGEDAVIQKVTWSGGKTPSEEDSVFGFLASPNDAKTYTF